MNDYKYIVYDNYGYIFPPFITHCEFARMNKFDTEQIQGAGFVSFGNKGACCYGKSVGLGIGSRGEKDNDVFNKIRGY